MGVRKETYLIYGIKFGEDFTNDYFEKEFRDEMDFDSKKDPSEPYFLTDGMNGDYTFFGFIKQLENGFNDFDEIIEINNDFDKSKIISVFSELYENEEINIPEIKMYFVPHYV